MAQPQLSAAAAVAEQHNCGDEEQEAAAALIPGLPRDLAVHCLALVPRGHYLARERHARKEEWLYVVGYGRPSQWLAYDFSKYKPCVWIYDVTTNHWVLGPPMQVGRADFFNVVLKNDILVGGGWITHDLRPARHVETLDCAKEESAWQSLPLILDTVIQIVREAFCLNGRLWTLHSAANVGGQSFGAQIYSPELKEWQQGPAFLVEDGVTASADDILYIVDRHCVLHTYTQISERGFPQLGAAATASAAKKQRGDEEHEAAAALIPGLPRDIAEHCMALVPRGHHLARKRHAKEEEGLYVVGYGRPNQWLAYDFTQVWIYDVTTNHWVLGAPMQVGRAECFNVVLKHDIMWVVVGIPMAYEESTWQSLPPTLDTVQRLVREAFCLNGRLWTLHTAANVGQSFGAQIYIPEVNEWQQGPAFLVESGASASANDTLYIVDRHARERLAKKEEWLYVFGYRRRIQWLAYDFSKYKPCPVWIYDVTTNHWVLGAPMQVGRANFFKVVSKNDILVGGGWITHEARPSCLVETLDCAKEESTWSSLPLLLDTKTQVLHTAFCINGRLWTLHSTANGRRCFGAQIYDPEVKEWQQGPAFLVEDGVSTSSNDTLYIVDNRRVLHTYTQISERGFVHESGRAAAWRRGRRRRQDARHAKEEEWLYVVGYGRPNQWLAYDFGDGLDCRLFQQIEPDFSNFRAAVVKRELYVMGGQSVNLHAQRANDRYSLTDEVWIHGVTTNQWVLGAPMQVGKADFFKVVFNNDILVGERTSFTPSGKLGLCRGGEYVALTSTSSGYLN
eukprot:SM000035S13103  [mRNA]  locus=s35:405739:433315:+ [translate_table: standard]